MVKTVILSGTEQVVTGLEKNNTLVINNSDAPVFASNEPNVEAYADNVIEISAGARDTVVGTNGAVYVLGTGRVELRGVDYVGFRRPSSSSGSSGGGETTETGVYCGAVEFTESSVGVKSIPIDVTDGLPRGLAAALAAETGWELQSDGVTVLKDGGVGFSFSEMYIYLANNINHQPSSANFQYINSADPYLDVCRSADKTAVAFGVRDANQNINLTFILARNHADEDVSIATYQGAAIYTLRRDRNHNTVSSVTPSPNMESAYMSVVLAATGLSLSKDVFLMYSCNATPQPGEQFTIDGKRFTAVYNTKYNGQPLLAIPV